MSRRVVVCLLAMMTVAMFAAIAGANDVTGASAAMDQVGTSTAAWTGRAISIAFIATILGLALGRIFDIKSVIAIPILFIIIGGILMAGPIFLAPFTVAGATLR